MLIFTEVTTRAQAASRLGLTHLIWYMLRIGKCIHMARLTTWRSISHHARSLTRLWSTAKTSTGKLILVLAFPASSWITEPQQQVSLTVKTKTTCRTLPRSWKLTNQSALIVLAEPASVLLSSVEAQTKDPTKSATIQQLSTLHPRCSVPCRI